VHQLVYVLADGLQSVLANQLLQSSDAGVVSSQLSSEVATSLVLRADLSQNEIEYIWDDFAAGGKADGWNDHSLLEYFPKCTDTSRSPSTDINVMGQTRDVAEKLTIDVHGRNQRDVIQMDAAFKGVVGDDRVARDQSIGVVFADCCGYDPD